MKTTLDINDALLANAKSRAAKERASLTKFIEEGLQLRLRVANMTNKRTKPRRFSQRRQCAEQ
jgi:hypothetical protein